MKLFVLAHRHPPVDRLVAHARPEMEAFAKAAQQSCHLGIYERGHVLVVTQVSSPGQWGLSIRLGARVGLLDTGSGHVLRTFQSAERVAEMLAELASLTGQGAVAKAKPTHKTVEAHIRTHGYWQGPSQQAVGVEDISVPILDPQGHATAVLTCPFVRSPTPQSSPDINATRVLLQRTASRLSMA
jgi:DNA-binding IclR family transcriptional regulator